MKTRSQIIRDFKEAVNMSVQELRDWLQTDSSKKVGQKPPGDQVSIGHHSGEKIVELLQKKDTDLSEEDMHHIQRVVSYVHRHLAQKPSSGIAASRWRYSLMNWGHDPLKNKK